MLLIQLIIATMPLERIGAFEIQGITIRISHLVAVILIAVTVARYKKIKQRIKPSHKAPILLLAAFLALGLYSACFALDPARAVQVVLYQALMIGTAIIIALQEWNNEKIRKVITIIWWTTIIVTIFGLFQYIGDIIGLPQSITGLRDIYTKEVFGFPRIQATALEPLYFVNALLLPLSIIMTSILVKKEQTGLTKKQLWIAFSLIILTGFLALSRGGYLGMIGAAGMLIIVLIKQKGIGKKIGKMAIVTTVIITVAVLGMKVQGKGDQKVFLKQATNVSEGAGVTERTETIKATVYIAVKYPLLGIGAGNFGRTVEPDQKEPPNGWRIVNNEPLELLVEHGIIGAGLLIVAMILIIVRALKALKTATGQRQLMLIALLGAVGGIIVQYQTFSTLYIMHIWVTIGLLWGLSTSNPQDSGQQNKKK